MLHAIGDDIRSVQGPNSKRLTYEPILCGTCNNARSQPWDRAYEDFERWVFEHESEILSRRFILLESVFGTDAYSASCCALYKYFVKAFGCRLVNAGMKVPRELVTLLFRDEFLTALRLAFAVNKTMFAVDPDTRRNYLGLGNLIRLDSQSVGVMERYHWHMQIGWLRVSFFYDIAVPNGFGSPWSSDSACLYLGEIEPTTLDELIEGARCNGAPVAAEWEALREQGGIKVE